MIKTRNKSHRGNGALRNLPSVFADGNITSDIGDVQYTEDCIRNASGVIRVSKSSIGSFYSMICVEKICRAIDVSTINEASRASI